MDEILKRLYNGEIFPAEQYIPELEEYKAKRKQRYKNYESFIEKIDSNLRSEFIKIMDEQSDLLPYELSEMFTKGFKLGALLMIEILEDKNQKL